MAVVLDSDAVVAFLDRGDALHGAADEAIRELLGKDPLLVSAVTYAEVLAGARRGRHDQARVRGFFSDLISEILIVPRSPTKQPTSAPAESHCGCRTP